MASSAGGGASAPLNISKSERREFSKLIAKAYLDAQIKAFKPTTDSKMIQIIEFAGQTVEDYDKERYDNMVSIATSDGGLLGDALAESISDFLEKHCAAASSATI
jgi:hypothetical protein